MSHLKVGETSQDQTGRPIPLVRHLWRWNRALVLTPLFLFFFLVALNSSIGDSPTMDEQNHIARGLALLRTGDPRFSLEHPPLVNIISALPLLTLPKVESHSVV